MEFLLRDSEHEIHDDVWTVHSSHYNCQVCIGCIVETLENNTLISLQKKPPLNELLRLLKHETSHIIQIFMAEETVVWHILLVLMDNLKAEDELYQAICIEAIIKLSQIIGSEDLVTSIVDNIVEKMAATRDHNKMVPYYMLMGKLLYQLPGLANKLILDYDNLLNNFAEDLCLCGEKVQSELAYIFIFLSPLQTQMSPRLLQNLQTGTLALLSTAQRKESQLNGLGLLKKLSEDDSNCQALFSVKKDDQTMLTVLKKFLLSKQHALQTDVGEILLLIMSKSRREEYGKAILNSDIAEFLFETLHTTSTEQIHCIVKVLQSLACLDHFYLRCHAVYGIESVLRCLTTAVELKYLTILEDGFNLMTAILQRQPSDIPLFINQNAVRNCLKVMQSGIEVKQPIVSLAALKSFKMLLRRDYLLSPVPFTEISQCVLGITETIQDRMSGGKKDGAGVFKGRAKVKSVDQEELLGNLCETVLKAANLAKQCCTDPTACECNYQPPSTDRDTKSDITVFVDDLLRLLDEHIIPVMVVCWNDIKQPDIFWNFFQLFPVFYDLDAAKLFDLVDKLVEVGFLGNMVDVIAIHRNLIPLFHHAAIYGTLYAHTDHGRSPQMAARLVIMRTLLLRQQPDDASLAINYIVRQNAALCGNELILSQTSPCFHVSAVQVLRILCEKRRNCRESLPDKYAPGIMMFMQFAVECYRDKDMMGCSLEHGSISPKHLRWTFGELEKGFDNQDVQKEEIEAYLAILYLSYRCGNRLLSDGELASILSSVVEMHTSLEQLSPMSKKQFIYLLAWLCTRTKFDMWGIIPSGMKSVPALLNGPVDTWYTDDLVMIKWCYTDQILAPMCGQKMLAAFLNFMPLERLQDRVEDVLDNVSRLYPLFDNRHFITDIVVLCSDSSADITRKLVLLQNIAIDYCTEISDDWRMAERCTKRDNTSRDQLQEIVKISAETLQNVFLKKYSKTSSHNIVSLLELYLKAYKYSGAENTFDKKILYHVLNVMKDDSCTDELQLSCLIAVLASLSKSGSQAVSMIVKQDHVMEHLETAMSDCHHPCHSIACDIVAHLIQKERIIEVHRPVSLNIGDMMENLGAKGGDDGGLGLLSALFGCGLKSNIICVEENLSPLFYKSFLLMLQQIIVSEVENASVLAVKCLLAMLSHLSVSHETLYLELQCQPWNRIMLEVLLDIGMETGLRYHHLALYSFFTKAKTTAGLLNSIPDFFQKLITLIRRHSQFKETESLISQILSNFEECLSEADKDQLNQLLS